MKKVSILVAAGLIAAGSVALAEQVRPEEGSHGGSYSAGKAEPSSKPMGSHAMRGTVSAVDHGSGLISVQTSAAPLRLYFPPEAIRDVKQGDKITTELAFWPGAASGSVRAGDVPATSHQGKLLGRHTMTGTVSSINQEKGTLGFTTDKGELQLHFPSSALRTVKDGDRISVEMAYFKSETGKKK